MQDSFPQLDLAYQRQNSSADESLSASQRRQAIEQELAPILEEVLAANCHDLQLFAQAEARFEQALAAVPDLEQRLQQLRERNRVLR